IRDDLVTGVQTCALPIFARGMRGNMVLQRARIEFLLLFRHSNSQQIAAPSFADEPAETFEARISRAKIQVQAHRRSIVIDHCRRSEERRVGIEWSWRWCG